MITPRHAKNKHSGQSTTPLQSSDGRLGFEGGSREEEEAPFDEFKENQGGDDEEDAGEGEEEEEESEEEVEKAPKRFGQGRESDDGVDKEERDMNWVDPELSSLPSAEQS